MAYSRSAAAHREPAGMVARIILGFGVLLGALLFGATMASAACTGGFLGQPTTPGEDLVVSGAACKVKPGTYAYGQVNIYAGGQLIFDEGDGPGNIDFWAKSIIIENKGALIAQNSKATPTTAAPKGRFGAKGSVLTIHLYGKNIAVWDEKAQMFASQNQGALCKTTQDKNNGPCGTPTDGNGNPVNGASITMPNGVTDNFYQYGPLYGDAACTPDGLTIFNSQTGTCSSGQAGYFGNKALAVSFGGTLQLYGYKGTSEVAPAADPTNSGYSWMRLNDGSSLATGDPSLTLEADPNANKLWVPGDEIVVTTTDYLPGHSEKLEIGTISTSTVGKNQTKVSTITFSTSPKNPGSVAKIQWPHNGARYGGPNDTAHKALSTRLKTRLQSSIDAELVQNGAETRAAVALLSRSIQIVSAGDTLPSNVMPGSNNFPDATATDPSYCQIKNAAKDPGPCHYIYGAQMVIRQGFQAVQISGVEFKQMGQGGRLGHYPVHFHRARQTPANTYVVDTSVNESMTRWFVIHSTLGVTLARNVGYMSIGHGYYLEFGNEADNNFYSNIGILARGAVQNTQNPRNVPGILADNQDPDDPIFAKPNVKNEGMPYRSDNEYPSVFWITNGWNDLIGNMAAGATTCGASYWLVPAANPDKADVGGAPMMWKGYAALQKDVGSAGTTPLKSFYMNQATSSMHSFQTTADAPPCDGIGAADAQIPMKTPLYPTLFAARSISPKPVRITVPASPGPPPTPQHTEPDNFNDPYYPHMLGGARHATYCNGDDCSTVQPCANGVNEEKCGVVVLDHYTSSFHWAQGNTSAIWLRPQWYLMDNNVLSDVQNGGFTMITGGDYTHSSIITGYWALARNSLFIGNTNTSPYASNIGPFNGASGLYCDALKTGQGVPPYCLNSAEGVSMPFGAFFSNQRLNNIYDGPSYQDSNAYLDVKTADCPLGSYNGSCMYGNGIPFLLLRKIPGNQSSGCYLPNAAIAWKQPNGFYYPPAFHSTNLQFDNVDIRHFVIDPLFQAPAGVTNTKTCGPTHDQSCDFGQGGTYLTDNAAVQAQYCVSSAENEAFNGWTSIDRQTELNDDDGSLTGLVNNVDVTKYPPRLKQTISVNEDTYFGAPIETAECLSAAGNAAGMNNTLPQNTTCPTTNASLPPPTVKTSPYDYVSTVVYHYPTAQDAPPSPDLPAKWSNTCSNQTCYGVPLYRQYLTGTMDSTGKNATREWQHWYVNGCFSAQNQSSALCRWPFIRMAGTDIPQRQTMTVNNGAYYLDTTVSYATQSTEPLNFGGYTPPPNQKRIINPATNLNVFTAGQTYTVFFLYAKPSTKQTYQIYVGKDFDTNLNGGLKAVRVNVDGSPSFGFTNVAIPTPNPDDPFWILPDTSQVANTGILTVTTNFSSSSVTDLTPSPAQNLCQPHTFCCPSADGPGVKTVTCNTAGPYCRGNLQSSNPIVKANSKLTAEADYICQNWAMKDLDCPAAGCYGFSFTLKGYTADDSYHRPAPVEFPATNTNQGAPNWLTTFDQTKTPPDSKSGGGTCSYQTLPNCPAGK